MDQNVKCEVCLRPCKRGINATWDNKREIWICDACTGVQRDAEGNAWHPGEYYHEYRDLKTGRDEIVTREQAFRMG